MDVSVVIPAYKSKQWLSRSIGSIVAVSRVIVVEDGVFDETQAVVATFPGARLLTLPENRGVVAARNAGLNEVKTPFVLFLDADDFLEGDMLDGLAEAMQETGADIGFGPWRSDGRSGRHKREIPRSCDGLEWLMHWLEGARWAWSWPGRIMWRTEKLREIGGWNQGMSRREDDEIMVRALLSDFKPAFSQEGSGVYWRHGGGSRSAANDDVEKYERAIVQMVKERARTHIQMAPRLEESLSIYCYRMACRDFKNMSAVSGRRWLSESRALGLKQHWGSKPHKLIAHILGLETKERLAARLNQHRRYKSTRESDPGAEIDGPV